MSWTKLPPIKGSTACLTCGCGSHDTLDMDRIIAVGFGSANATKNSECVYDEQEMLFKAKEWEANGRQGPEPDWWQASDVEALALKDPDHDWRIHFYAPLYEAHYQRQGENHWVLIAKGDGFA